MLNGLWIEPSLDKLCAPDRRQDEVDPDTLATCPNSHVPVPPFQHITSLEHWLDLCA